MKQRILLLALLLFTSLSAQAQFRTTIRGQVLDSATAEPVGQVYVGADRSIHAVPTNGRGQFLIKLKNDYPLRLTFEKEGYKRTEYIIKTDESLDEIVVEMAKGHDGPLTAQTYAGHRHEQSLGDVPFELYALNSEELMELPAYDPYEAIGYLPSVELMTNGPNNHRLNARGFGDFQNQRFLQLIDGMDNQIPAAGYAAGNLIGISSLDIDRVEVLAGGQTAIYGPNAMNGVLNIRSKSPFKDQGLSAMLRMASTGSENTGTMLSLRYADSPTQESAYKINLSYSQSGDWLAQSTENIRPGADPESLADTDPGYNGLHIYGDEESTLFPFGVSGADIVVARTGYAEQDLMPATTTSFKLDAAYHYKITDRTELILDVKARSADWTYTGIHRGRVEGYSQTQFKGEVRGRHYFARYYAGSQSFSQSYDAEMVGRNMLLAAKSNTSWFQDYGAAFGGALIGDGIPGGDPIIARAFADGVGLNLFGVEGPMFEPGTAQYDFVLGEIINNNVDFLQNRAPRSELENNTAISHAEAMYNFSHLIPWFDAQAGAHYRVYTINTDSDIASPGLFFDAVKEQGAYLNLSRRLMGDQLYLTGTGRVDKNEFFSGQLNYRLGANYEVAKGIHLRAAFSTSFRNPSFTEQYIDKDIGEGRLRGGSIDFTSITTPPPNPQVISVVGNAIFLDAVERYTQAYERDIAAGFTLEETINRNLFLLGEGIVEEGDIQLLNREKNTSMELGFRGEIMPDLVLDFSAWESRYDGYIGRIGVVRPFTTLSVTADTAAAALLVRDKRTRQVAFYYGNASDEVKLQGITTALRYSHPRGWLVGLQGRLTKFTADEDEKILIQPNTPGQQVQVTLGHRKIIENLGASLVYRWQDDTAWQGNFAGGTIPAFGTLNLQVNYRLPEINGVIQVGGTNVLGTNYFDYYGGPNIGSTFYAALRINGLSLN